MGKESENTLAKSKKFDILIISDDVVGERMAGPGIRAWELARVLARKFKVILARPDYSPPHLPTTDIEFPVISYTVGKEAELLKFVRQSRIVLIQGYILNKFPEIKRVAEWLIVDMYVPFVLENLFIHQQKIPRLLDREFIHRRDLQVFNELLLWADHFLCATEKQKDLLTGCLLSLNRINPAILDNSPDLSDLISVVPFGLQSNDATKEEHFTKIIDIDELSIKNSEDTLFLWGGVISNWFDPMTLISAFDEARKINPKIRLLFLSTTHPNPLLPKLDMATKAYELSSSLGLLGTYVFFNQDWVPYEERGKYFQAADVGVSIHKIHFETRFSFRTRMLDYIRYEIPILCTEGDFFADLVREKNLGLVVPEGDVFALREAILKMASSPEIRTIMKKNLRLIKGDFAWEKVCEPLLTYCKKVLKGEMKRLRPIPSSKSLFPLFLPRKETWLRRLSRRPWLWKRLQKIPAFMAIPLKRLLK